MFNGYIEKATFYNEYPAVSRGMYFNLSRPPLDNLDVRIGLQHASNWQKVIDLDLRNSRTSQAQVKKPVPVRRHQRIVRPDRTVRNAGIYVGVLAALAGGLVVGAAAVDLRGVLTSSMEFYAELSYWWMRGVLAASALVLVNNAAVTAEPNL